MGIFRHATCYTRELYMPGARRLYGSAWRRARAAYLAQRPLCVMCQAQGRIVAASVVDHVIPHKGSAALFWDSANWQPLCKWHHDGAKQAAERSNQSGTGCDERGRPLDPARRAEWGG